MCRHLSVAEGTEVTEVTVVHHQEIKLQLNFVEEAASVCGTLYYTCKSQTSQMVW